MKVFMRDRSEKLAIAGLCDEVVLSDCDVSGVQMFNAVGCLSLDFEQEEIFFVRKLAEDGHCLFDNVLNIREHLRCAHRNIPFAEDKIMASAPGLEIEDLELTDESGRIDEDVVVARDVKVVALLESGINLPAARRAVLKSARHVLLPDDIHKGRWRSQIGHLISELRGVKLISDIDVFGRLLADPPRLLVGLLPTQRLIASVRCVEVLDVARVVLDAIHTG